MERFIEGNRAFRKGLFQKQPALFARLRQGQHPVALYIGCSDSRVPIELITGALPGDLYVIRNVGDAVPPSYYADSCVGAAVEYAVSEIQVAHAIVCGHYGCGATAALAEGPAGAIGLPLHLNSWLMHIRPVLQRVQEKDSEARLRRLAEKKVRLQVANLRTYACFEGAEQSGRLRQQAWICDGDEGLLLEDRGDGAFLPL